MSRLTMHRWGSIAWALALVAVAVGIRHALALHPIFTFVGAAAAIAPLAEVIRRATEAVAHRAGATIGGLLTVTFGNAAELVLAIFVLLAGHPQVVKAQITGSIIGNGLLAFGIAIAVATWRGGQVKFDAARAGHLASLLTLVVIALLVPALFNYTERGIFASTEASSLDERLSLCVAVVLIALYAANLVYTLVTKRDAFAHGSGEQPHAPWPLWFALAALVAATALTAWMADLVSASLEQAAAVLHVSTFFLGVVVLANVGNAAEFLSSAYFAASGRVGLAVTITIGSTIQVALLLAPVVVIVSNFTGHAMNLVFANPLELVAIASVAFVVNAITRDGEATWFEGVLLIGVWSLLALAFLFATPPAG